MTDSRSAQWAGRGGAEWRGGRVPCAGCRGRGLAEEECREAAAVPLVGGADGRRPEPCWAAEPRRPSRPSCPTSARRCGARPGGRADGAAGLRGGLSRSPLPFSRWVSVRCGGRTLGCSFACRRGAVLAARLERPLGTWLWFTALQLVRAADRCVPGRLILETSPLCLLSSSIPCSLRQNNALSPVLMIASAGKCFLILLISTEQIAERTLENPLFCLSLTLRYQRRVTVASLSQLCCTKPISLFVAAALFL